MLCGPRSRSAAAQTFDPPRPLVAREFLRKIGVQPEIGQFDPALTPEPLELLLDDVMMPGTGRLPHGPVPEAHHVAVMWLDVVNDLRGDNATDGLASEAEWML